MRIIAGSAKSIQLRTLPGDRVRPTTDAMRETLFSSIAADVPGCRFLDLFAGTGAVGIEALSRGAEFALFVERDPRCCDVITENLAATHLADRAEIIRADVLAALSRLPETHDAFDIVFADPPYTYPHLADVLRSLREDRPAIADDALIIIQHHRDQDLTTVTEPRKTKQFGDSVLSMFW
jgi:16S rRNA (guanine966-N2)-methyltransferase